MKRDRVTRAIGFRPTEPWGDDPKGNRWCAWAGPLFLNGLHHRRIRPRLQVLTDREWGWLYVALSWLGISLSVNVNRVARRWAR